jgi:hypothetical protein
MEEYYLDVVPPSDPNMRNAYDLYLINIRISHSHSIVAKAPIMPCYEAVEWIILPTLEQEMLLVMNGYPFSEIENYYRLHELDKHVITRFAKQFHKERDIRKILISWWVEDKRFF